MNSIILSYITFVYFASFMLYLLMMVMGKEFFGRLATFVTLAGLLGQSLAILLRWIESYELGIGHAPLSNLYESLIFFAWTIVFLYLLIEWRTKNRSLGAFATPLRFPGHGLRLLFAHDQQPDSASGACPQEQLADRPCAHLFLRLCRLRPCLWVKPYVPLEETGKIPRGAISSFGSFRNPPSWRT